MLSLFEVDQLRRYFAGVVGPFCDAPIDDRDLAVYADPERAGELIVAVDTQPPKAWLYVNEVRGRPDDFELVHALDLRRLPPASSPVRIV